MHNIVKITLAIAAIGAAWYGYTWYKKSKDEKEKLAHDLGITTDALDAIKKKNDEDEAYRRERAAKLAATEMAAARASIGIDKGSKNASDIGSGLGKVNMMNMTGFNN